MSKVAEVIEPTFRSGVGKNGQPWVLSKVLTDDGKEATGFSLNVGDEVKLTYNETYKNYSAEKLTPQKKQQGELEDTLKLILSSLGRIEKHLGITGYKAPEPTPVGVEEPQEEDYGSLPF